MFDQEDRSGCIQCYKYISVLGLPQISTAQICPFIYCLHHQYCPHYLSGKPESLKYPSSTIIILYLTYDPQCINFKSQAFFQIKPNIDMICNILYQWVSFTLFHVLLSLVGLVIEFCLCSSIQANNGA